MTNPGDGEPSDREGFDAFRVRLYLKRATPRELLDELVEDLNSPANPDQDLCVAIGCGNLENLLRDHEGELWPEIERLARADVRFRRALASVWAYDSPLYERRQQLLSELGEHREIVIRFFVEPDGFGDDPPLSWRAEQVDGEVRDHRLAEVLRSIADYFDEQATGTEPPRP